MNESQILNGPIWKLTGLMFGMIFGFLLQRGHVLRYDRQISLLLLNDMTVLKYMLSAALVGMAGTALLRSIDYIEIGLRPVFLAPIIIGGLIYGLGWAIAGYCPGTQLAAFGEGRIDALGAILGSWFGALAYYPMYPWCVSYLYPVGRLENFNLDLELAVDPWLVTAACAVLFIPLFIFFEWRRI